VKIISKGKYEVLDHTAEPGKAIERKARICWDSIDKIKEGSAESFVRKLIKRGHMTPLEAAYITVEFSDISIGMTRELNRHRLTSPMEQSTRYVKQDDLHFVISPGKDIKEKFWIDSVNSGWDDEHATIQDIVKVYENVYNALLERGWKKEDARQFLPLGTTTVQNLTCNFRELRHIFELRCNEHAHWEIRNIMKELLTECIERWPCCFEDLSYLLGEKNESSSSIKKNTQKTS
jgi:thymidylate synthase (FAD)